jgi:hypothetical protein
MKYLIFNLLITNYIILIINLLIINYFILIIND